MARTRQEIETLLEEWRKSGLTGKAFAKKAGIGYSSLTKYKQTFSKNGKTKRVEKESTAPRQSRSFESQVASLISARQTHENAIANINKKLWKKIESIGGGGGK